VANIRKTGPTTGDDAADDDVADDAPPRGRSAGSTPSAPAAERPAGRVTARPRATDADVNTDAASRDRSSSSTRSRPEPATADAATADAPASRDRSVGPTASRSEPATTSDRAANEPAADRAASTRPVGLLGAMWRFKGMCVLIVVVCTALSALLGYLLAPQPTASATIALRTPGQDNVLLPGVSGDAALSRYTAQRARFVTSDAVLGNVADSIGASDLNALRERLEVQPSTDSNIITIIASGATGNEAVKLAGQVARAYGEETAKQVDELTDAALDSIEESADRVRATITSNNIAVNDAAASTLGQLQQRASSIRTTSAVLDDGVEFVVKPDEDAVQSNDFPLKEAGLGFVLGLVIAGTVAYLRADSEAAARRAD